MGGDRGPAVVVPAAIRALKIFPELKLILVGDERKIRRFLKKCKFDLSERLQLRHTTEEVAMDESPASALRTKKDSSMRVAIDLVKSGEAHACVSAGNTGALMATARFVLKTLPGVDRPAIMAALPTLDRQPVYVLDLGANVDSSADHLHQFAIMGSVVVAALEDIPAPRVGLLNIGEEDIKGNDQVKRTAQLLSENAALNYIGYVEGDGLYRGVADVVVCDGFSGNVLLKASEGMAKLIMHYMEQAFRRNILTKLLAIVAWPVLKMVKRTLDPDRYNGASFVGLQGIVIKSHGGANRVAFVHAIKQAILEVEQSVADNIHKQAGAIAHQEGAE